jgi:hypothetical protein
MKAMVPSRQTAIQRISVDQLAGIPEEGSVSKVEMATPITLIYKLLFPSISTFETPPTQKPCTSEQVPSRSCPLS